MAKNVSTGKMEGISTTGNAGNVGRMPSHQDISTFHMSNVPACV